LPKLKPISHNELLRGLRSFGFDGPFAGGRHLYMIRGNLRLTVPNPHREKIGIHLLMRILRQAGISKEEWMEKE
jgi:predicted RNA binding protein YcfA (HicA-like mRNA interferase family)